MKRQVKKHLMMTWSAMSVIVLITMNFLLAVQGANFIIFILAVWTEEKHKFGKRDKNGYANAAHVTNSLYKDCSFVSTFVKEIEKPKNVDQNQLLQGNKHSHFPNLSSNLLQFVDPPFEATDNHFIETIK